MTFVSAGEGGRGGKHLRRARRGSVEVVPEEVRVLIVEDEWLIALEIEATLMNAGYKVVGIAVSADEAVAMAERLQPHVATMDIRLHGPRDGVDAAVELYSRFGLRCLFVSAYASDATKARAAAANPLGWHQKPFFAAQIARALTQALRGKDR